MPSTCSSARNRPCGHQPHVQIDPHEVARAAEQESLCDCSASQTRRAYVTDLPTVLVVLFELVGGASLHLRYTT